MYTLMKFYADWCGPCKAMLPTMEMLKNDLEGEIIFVDVDIDNNPQVRQDYHIRSIPAFVLLKDKQEVARRTGSAGLGDLKEWLDESRGL